MNKIVTGIAGGFPLTQEVWAHAHNGIAEAFKGVMSAYGIDDSTAIILSGCERSVSVGVVTITEGFVSIGGEVCRFPEQTFAEPVAPDDLEYFEINVSYDPAGDVAFETSGNNDTREIRTAKVTAASVIPAGHTAFEDAPTIHQVIQDSRPEDTWHDIVVPGIGTYSYKKDFNKGLLLKGGGTLSDPSTGACDLLMFTLPAGHWPAITMQKTIHTIISGTLEHLQISISHTNGEVRLKYKSVAGGVLFYLNGVDFPLT